MSVSNYLIEGEDYVSVQSTIKDVILKNDFDEVVSECYDLADNSLEKALEDLDTYGLFSDKKIVIVNNVDLLSKEENSKDLDHLYRYLDDPNPANLLFLCSKKLNSTLKVTKELKKKCTYIKAELDKNKFVKELLADYKIDNKALNLLFEYCLDDITKLENEIIKLKTYKCKEKTINEKDVLDLCVAKLGDASELTFSFSRSLAEKDKKRALEKYRELLNYNIEPLSIVGLLASQIRIIYQVKCLRDEGLNNNEIATKLDVKPYRVTKTLELTNYYTFKELLNLMINLQKIDLQIKTTSVDANSLVELFILNI